MGNDGNSDGTCGGTQQVDICGREGTKRKNTTEDARRMYETHEGRRQSARTRPMLEVECRQHWKGEHKE